MKNKNYLDFVLIPRLYSVLFILHPKCTENVNIFETNVLKQWFSDWLYNKVPPIESGDLNETFVILIHITQCRMF